MPYLLIAVLAFLAGVLGGISGYGSGLILPPFLLPVTGPEPIVPIITIAALSINASRAFAFREEIDWRRALIVVPCALPTCMLGAYIYSSLSGPAVWTLIGSTLIVLVPVRRLAFRANLKLSLLFLGLCSAVYGLIVGSTAGSGIILVSILLATGIGGAAVVATDSVISIVLGLLKITVFNSTGSLTTQVWVMAFLIGASATPGAFVAKRIEKASNPRARRRARCRGYIWRHRPARYRLGHSSLNGRQLSKNRGLVRGFFQALQ